MRVGFDRLKRRSEAEDETGQECNSERKEECTSVDGHPGESRQVGRRDREQRFKSPNRHGPTGKRTEQREQKALGCKLANQTKTSGAECNTNGHLFLARRSAR